MLNQQSYTAKREKLTQDIGEAQREVDAALAGTEGRTDARVHALKHALASLQQQRVDLDTAWRATEAQAAPARQADEVKRRQAVLATVASTTAQATHAIAELQTIAARYRELVAGFRVTDQTIRQTLMPFTRGVHGRDTIDMLPSLVPDDDELTEILAGRLDLTSHIKTRSARLGEMARRLVFPTPVHTYEVTTDEVSL